MAKRTIKTKRKKIKSSNFSIFTVSIISLCAVLFVFDALFAPAIFSGKSVMGISTRSTTTPTSQSCLTVGKACNIYSSLRCCGGSHCKTGSSGYGSCVANSTLTPTRKPTPTRRPTPTPVRHVTPTRKPTPTHHPTPTPVRHVTPTPHR